MMMWTLSSVTGHDYLSICLYSCAYMYACTYVRSNATSVASAAINTIAMTAEEKKALRAEQDRKKKAAKKRKVEEERQRRIIQEAEKARVAALEFLAERARNWSPWAPVYQFGVDFRGFVSGVSFFVARFVCSLIFLSLALSDPPIRSVCVPWG